MKKFKDFKSLYLPVILFGATVTGVCVGAIKYAWDTEHDDRLLFGNSKISYSDSDGEVIADGEIPYRDVESYVKVVTYKKDDVIFDRLSVVRSEHHVGSRVSGAHFSRSYTDLESGTELKSYIFFDRNDESNCTYSVGEELEIVDVKDFINDLYTNGCIKKSYSVNELLDIYHNNYSSDNVKTLQK